jgi:dipeptidyl aminopeptidase/acylaminoacyl peptidase
MVERFRALGAPVECTTLEGEGHGFVRRERRIHTQQRTIESLERNLFRR